MKRLLSFGIILLVMSEACTTKTPSSNTQAPHARKVLVAGDTSLMMDGVEYYQRCSFTDLSDSFDYDVDFSRYHESESDTSATAHIKVMIIDKRTATPMDTVRVNACFLYSMVFEDCMKARSYMTCKNADSTVLDNDYGELVIGDFNFDNKEDLAVINDSGGNSGPTYNFYLQDDKRHFAYNSFLSDTMEFIPGDMNKKAKTLVTYGHSSACSVGVHTYVLDSTSFRFKLLSFEIVGICK